MGGLGDIVSIYEMLPEPRRLSPESLYPARLAIAIHPGDKPTISCFARTAAEKSFTPRSFLVFMTFHSFIFEQGFALGLAFGT